MLGNFSFGQYFKEGAIEFATEFIREQLRARLGPHLGQRPSPATPSWRSARTRSRSTSGNRSACRRERIVPLPSSENFWSVGGPGPCGPDSEIYYDWGAGARLRRRPTACRAASRCERFLEFWNLVFMEYELHADGTLTPLPQQNIDTGLGLERAARIVQNVPSVYDTDGYQLIMEWIAAESGRRVRRLDGGDEGAPRSSPTTRAG